MMKMAMVVVILTAATGAMACCNPHPPQIGSGQGVIAQKQPIHQSHKKHKANTVCLGKLCYKPFHGVFVR